MPGKGKGIVIDYKSSVFSSITTQLCYVTNWHLIMNVASWLLFVCLILLITVHGKYLEGENIGEFGNSPNFYPSNVLVLSSK